MLMRRFALALLAVVAPLFAAVAAPLFAADAAIRIQPPVVATTGGLVVVESSELATCLGPLCRVPQLVIDGVAVDLLPALSAASLSLAGNAPPHAAGTVDVMFIPAQPDRAAVTLPHALHYFDRGEPVDLALFEPVYFPVTYSGPGSFGTDWETRIAMFSPAYVRTFNFGDLNSSFTEVPRFPSREEGFILYVDRTVSDRVVWSARVRERRTTPEHAGTALPVVRERETGPVQYVINVPFERNHRGLLRIAGIDRVERDVEVRVYIEPNSLPLVQTVHLRAPQSPDAPAFATVDVTAQRPQFFGTTARLHIISNDPAARLFAFVTVTDNVTQHVTVIEPE